jgi:hypothetical protein
MSSMQASRRKRALRGRAVDGLEEVTRHIDSGMPIPKTKMKTAGSSVDETSRSLKIEPIRLGCWGSEAALVRLLARHERPDVAVAVERWRRHRRPRKASPPQWLSRFALTDRVLQEPQEVIKARKEAYRRVEFVEQGVAG